MIYLLCLSFRA